MGQGEVLKVLQKKKNKDKYMGSKEVSQEVKYGKSSVGSVLKKLADRGEIIRKAKYETRKSPWFNGNTPYIYKSK